MYSNSIVLSSEELTQILTLLEGELSVVCAFRMAAKDIRDGQFSSAASRIQSDFDKVNVWIDSSQKDLLKRFIKANE